MVEGCVLEVVEDFKELRLQQVALKKFYNASGRCFRRQDQKQGL